MVTFADFITKMNAGQCKQHSIQNAGGASSRDCRPRHIFADAFDGVRDSSPIEAVVEKGMSYRLLHPSRESQYFFLLSESNAGMRHFYSRD